MSKSKSNSSKSSRNSGGIWRPALVAVLLVGSLSLVGVFASGRWPGKAPNAQAQAQVAETQQPAGGDNQQLSGVITPDLSRIDPYQMLALVPVGNAAPNFTVRDAMGKTLSLSQFRQHKNVVIVFYQGSFCSVCGHQLSDIQSHFNEFKQQNAEVIAVSADDTAHARTTLGERGLSFHVVPDANKKLIKLYGVQNFSKAGIAWPSVFVVDKKGVVRLSFADNEGTRLHSDRLLPVLMKINGQAVH